MSWAHSFRPHSDCSRSIPDDSPGSWMGYEHSICSLVPLRCCSTPQSARCDRFVQDDSDYSAISLFQWAASSLQAFWRLACFQICRADSQKSSLPNWKKIFGCICQRTKICSVLCQNFSFAWFCSRKKLHLIDNTYCWEGFWNSFSIGSSIEGPKYSFIYQPRFCNDRCAKIYPSPFWNQARICSARYHWAKMRHLAIDVSKFECLSTWLSSKTIEMLESFLQYQALIQWTESCWLKMKSTFWRIPADWWSRSGLWWMNLEYGRTESSYLFETALKSNQTLRCQTPGSIPKSSIAQTVIRTLPESSRHFG